VLIKCDITEQNRTEHTFI